MAARQRNLLWPLAAAAGLAAISFAANVSHETEFPAPRVSAKEGLVAGALSMTRDIYVYILPTTVR